MKIFFKYLLRLALILGLTIITQIGGIVLLITFLINNYWKRKFRFKILSIFSALYLISTFVLVPKIAVEFGRERIKHTEHIRPTMFLTDLLNRNYVRPELNRVLQQCERTLSKEGIVIKYLDANFPFINGFPLLPHLSHSDGKKLDISLMYKNADHSLSNKKKSNSGYGVFEGPNKKEFDQIAKCKKQGYFQYDFSKYLTLGSKNKTLIYSNAHTKNLVTAILKNKSIGKIFIEPHLKTRLGIQDNRIRYHGCQAVRHDDHIHIQLR